MLSSRPRNNKLSPSDSKSLRRHHMSFPLWDTRRLYARVDIRVSNFMARVLQCVLQLLVLASCSSQRISLWMSHYWEKKNNSEQSDSVGYPGQKRREHNLISSPLPGSNCLKSFCFWLAPLPIIFMFWGFVTQRTT